MPPAPDAAGRWVLSDVFLLTEGKEGRVAVPGLQLDLGPATITVTKTSGDPVWSCRWDELREMSTAERSVLPDGTEGIVVFMEEHGGRRHRFVVPTTEPAQTEIALRDCALSHHLATRLPPRAVSRVLTAVVALATVATLTVLLLSAAHVLRF